MSIQKDPELILRFSRAKNGFDGYLVIDNTVFGPGCGGIRMLDDVSEEEVKLLAQSKTVKYAISGVLGGGAKAGIKLSPDNPERRKILKRFAYAIRPLILSLHFVPGPEMGTNDEDVIYIYKCVNAMELLNGSILLTKVNGISLAQSMTAYGVIESLTTTNSLLNINLPTKTVAVEGFGRIGSLIALELVDRGYIITAVSNKNYMIFDPSGLDIKTLFKMRRKYGDECLELYTENVKNVNLRSPSEIFSLETDVLIPSSRPHVINGDNAEEVNSKIIVPCANNPIDEEAEQSLFDRGVIVLPDFISNSGGIISGMAHRIGLSFFEIQKVVKDIIRKNIASTLRGMRGEKLSLRRVALNITQERLKKAMKCKLFIYKYFLENWHSYIANPTAIRRCLWYVNRRWNSSNVFKSSSYYHLREQV